MRQDDDQELDRENDHEIRHTAQGVASFQESAIEMSYLDKEEHGDRTQIDHRYSGRSDAFLDPGDCNAHT